MGNNVAHLESKIESFENYLKTETPAVFMLQETKMKRAGKLKTETTKDYIIYEMLRKKDKVAGGGLALGVLKALQPAFINEGDDEVETLTVEVWVEDFPIRLVVAYGPQNVDRDNDPNKHKEKKKSFRNQSKMRLLKLRKMVLDLFYTWMAIYMLDQKLFLMIPIQQMRMENCSKLFLKGTRK